MALALWGQDALVALAREGELPREPEQRVRCFWLPASPLDVPPGASLTLAESRRRLAFRRADVPTMARRTLIKVPEVPGAEVRSWVVDVVEQPAGPDELRVLVLPLPAAEAA